MACEQLDKQLDRRRTTNRAHPAPGTSHGRGLLCIFCFTTRWAGTRDSTAAPQGWGQRCSSRDRCSSGSREGVEGRKHSGLSPLPSHHPHLLASWPHSSPTHSPTRPLTPRSNVGARQCRSAWFQWASRPATFWQGPAGASREGDALALPAHTLSGEPSWICCSVHLQGPAQTTQDDSTMPPTHPASPTTRRGQFLPLAARGPARRGS